MAEKHLSELLSEYRKRENITQEEAAKKLGVPLRSYQNWEQGTSYPQFKTWQKIQAAIDAPAKV